MKTKRRRKRQQLVRLNKEGKKWIREATGIKELSSEQSKSRVYRLETESMRFNQVTFQKANTHSEFFFSEFKREQRDVPTSHAGD